MLAEAVQANARIVLLRYGVKRDLSACILRFPMLSGAERSIIGVAVIVRPVVVVKRGHGQEQTGLERAHPRNGRKRIALAFNVSYSGRLCIGIVRDLIIIPPQ